MLDDKLNADSDKLLVDHSLVELNVETLVENNPSEDAQLLQHSGAMEDGLKHGFKVREKALKYEQMRMSDRLILPAEEDVAFENEDDVQESGSNKKMELMRQERSQKDVLSMDDLTLENIKTVLKKLLKRTGLGKCPNMNI